jgi:hypothetical protein
VSVFAVNPLVAVTVMTNDFRGVFEYRFTLRVDVTSPLGGSVTKAGLKDQPIFNGLGENDALKLTLELKPFIERTFTW